MTQAFDILERKRAGGALAEADLRAIARGATDGSWSEAQLGAFLMAAAIHGLDGDETRALTVAMLESGETWDLAADFPVLVDKHSTGGVADTVSLILSPILAACDVPVVMLTGRALGHTGGTADKLESIPGLRLDFDRAGCCRLLDRVAMAIGIATAEIAPADRCLYRLRDQTATIDSLPLITASIVSKKLATGASALVFDVKTGGGAFLPQQSEAEALARLLVETVEGLGRRSSALITEMSQPLGEWVGHGAEVFATLEALEGRGAPDLMAVTYALGAEVARLAGVSVTGTDLEAAVTSGRARERFDRWAELQGAEAAWLRQPRCELAPVEVALEAPAAGYLAAVDNRRLGMLLSDVCRDGGSAIDAGVSLRCRKRLGEAVERGEELARLYLRREDGAVAAAFRDCFEVTAQQATSPTLLRGHITA